MSRINNAYLCPSKTMHQLLLINFCHFCCHTAGQEKRQGITLMAMLAQLHKMTATQPHALIYFWKNIVNTTLVDFSMHIYFSIYPFRFSLPISSSFLFHFLCDTARAG